MTGNLIGGTGITSFASQLFLGDLPNPPETSVAILRGYINIGQISTQRILTISNKQFGSGNTAGLTFYHDASLSNKQSGAPAASEGPPVHINATILVSGIPCPPISFQSIDSNSPAQPSGVATLSVSSTGGTAIHWLKDGVPLTNGGRISGAETPTLTINPPTASDAGSYRAQVSNDCGNMKVSGPAMLEVVCTADLDRDGLVADSDFVYFVHAYDQFLCPAEPAACAADLNADHFVDDLDFQVFVVQYDALVCP